MSKNDSKENGKPLSLSVSFAEGDDDTEHSVALYYDDGRLAIRCAVGYIEELWEYRDATKQVGPMDVHMAMVDYVRYISRRVPIVDIDCGWRLFPSTMYGPPTDLGHFIFSLDNTTITHYADSPFPSHLDHRDINGRYQQ